MIVVDDSNEDSVSMKLNILSILKNIVKQDECLAIRIVNKYHLLKLIESHLKDNHLQLQQETLDCLLQLTKHGKSICDLVLDNGMIMSQLLCLCCSHTKHASIALKSLKIIKILCPYCQSDCQYSADLLRCLLTVLNRPPSNLNIPSLAIECLNTWNDKGIHSKCLVDENIVDVMIKYIHFDTTKKAALLLCQQLSETSDEACDRMMHNGLIESFICFIPINENGITIQSLNILGNIANKSDHYALVLSEYRSTIKYIWSLLSEVKCPSDALLSSCIHALQNMCKYSSRHLEMFLSHNLFSYFNNLHQIKRLQTQIEEMFVLLLPWCNDTDIMEKMFFCHLPVKSRKSKLFECILQSFCNILPRDCEARKYFVQHGLLKIIVTRNELFENPSSICRISIENQKLKVWNPEYKPLIRIILSCFPPELIRYYDEHFKIHLLIEDDLNLTCFYNEHVEEDMALNLYEGSVDIGEHLLSA